MTDRSDTACARPRDCDIFVERFFLGGARNYLRKTTQDASWMSVGIMESMNPMLLQDGRLFSGMNLVGGGAYSLGHGLIHGYLQEQGAQQIKRAVENLNALPTEEIVFYHDESLCGLAQAAGMGLQMRFRAVSLLEWLVREVRGRQGEVRPLNAPAAVQLPCSSSVGGDRNALLDELLGLLGVRRVERRYDRERRLCCGVRGYFGLLGGDVAADTARADELVAANMADAQEAGAEYLVTLCPACYCALAPRAQQAGLTPVQIEGLVALALYGETPRAGLTFQ